MNSNVNETQDSVCTCGDCADCIVELSPKAFNKAILSAMWGIRESLEDLTCAITHLDQQLKETIDAARDDSAEDANRVSRAIYEVAENINGMHVYEDNNVTEAIEQLRYSIENISTSSDKRRPK